MNFTLRGPRCYAVRRLYLRYLCSSVLCFATCQSSTRANIRFRSENFSAFSEFSLIPCFSRLFKLLLSLGCYWLWRVLLMLWHWTYTDVLSLASSDVFNDYSESGNFILALNSISDSFPSLRLNCNLRIIENSYELKSRLCLLRFPSISNIVTRWLNNRLQRINSCGEILKVHSDYRGCKCYSYVIFSLVLKASPCNHATEKFLR